MAITRGAKKAIRVARRKKVFNDSRERTMKDTVKEIRTLLAEGKREEAMKLLPKAYQSIDKAKKRGVIKKNTAARKKSRLSKAIRNIK